MTYDDRLIIKREFNFNSVKRINKLKLVQNVDFVQIFINNGKTLATGEEKYAQMRLDRSAIEKIIKYLQNSLLTLK